jgi:hypothetical protein
VEFLSLSLCLCLSMARGILSLSLSALIVVVFAHQSCSAEDDSHICPASSCGNIRNISYPFRLKSDSEHCGDPRYILSCENNQTVLYLNGARYYVQEINYNYNYTIRLVYPGILNDTDSTVDPLYPLDFTNISSGDPYYPSYVYNFDLVLPYVVLVNCEKPVNSRRYLDISTCINSSLSHSKRYTYILLGPIWDLEDLCQVEQISLTSWSHQYVDDFRNMSCTNIRNELLRGFELSWYRAYCGSCRSYDDCGLDDGVNQVVCDPYGA